MSKETSNTRKIKRSKPAKTFAKQVEQENERKKEKLKEMPIWTKIGGISILPLIICMWLIDRSLFLMMPHASHPSLKQYLLDASSLKMTIARMLIFGIPATIVWIIMR